MYSICGVAMSVTTSWGGWHGVAGGRDFAVNSVGSLPVGGLNGGGGGVQVGDRIEFISERRYPSPPGEVVTMSDSES